MFMHLLFFFFFFFTEGADSVRIPSLTSLMVSVEVKHHVYLLMCENY